VKRWERPLLLFSVALNVAFVGIAATRHVGNRDMPPPLPPHPELRPEAMAMRRHHLWRHERLARTLRLNAAQRARWDTQFSQLAPAIESSRSRLQTARITYRQALLGSDVSGVRLAAHAVSRAQAAVDSLYAEAMAAETAVLRPDQRRRYVRWTLHGDGGRDVRRRGQRAERSRD